MKKIKSKVKKYNWGEIGQRAFFSFVQGVVIYLGASLGGLVVINKAELISLGMGAITAGLSAVMNLIAQEMEMRQYVKRN